MFHANFSYLSIYLHNIKKDFFGGIPPFGPLKVKSPKARAQYIKNQLSYNHFKFEKKYLIFFLKFWEILLTAVIADRGGEGEHVDIILEHSLINLPIEGIAKGVEKNLDWKSLWWDCFYGYKHSTGSFKKNDISKAPIIRD